MRELAVSEAAAALAGGSAVVIPTDTVYGVAVSPYVPGAVDALLRVKRRPRGVPVPVLVADVAQARRLVQIEDRAALLTQRLWPGPLTIVLPRAAGVDVDVGSDTGEIGVRCPDHPIARALCEAVGPLAASSANVHGEPTPTTARACAEVLGVDYVDGGEIHGAASSVCDATGDEVVLVREGPITASDLEAAVSG